MPDCLVLSVLLENHSIYVWYDWILQTYIVKGHLSKTQSTYSYCMDTTGNVVNYIKNIYSLASLVKVQLLNYSNLPDDEIRPELLKLVGANVYGGTLLNQIELYDDTFARNQETPLRICDKLHSLVNVVGKTYNYYE